MSRTNILMDNEIASQFSRLFEEFAMKGDKCIRYSTKLPRCCFRHHTDITNST